MRLDNHLSPASNRAALSITQTLYDRRALDCTSNRPLVPSLQQLMILTGSSSRVRETLCADGGLERIVQMMKDCYLEWQDPLVACKWHLCLQCLLNLGARGSEQVRQRIIEAGAIPVLATVLDNYLLAYQEAIIKDRASVCASDCSCGHNSEHSSAPAHHALPANSAVMANSVASVNSLAPANLSNVLDHSADGTNSLASLSGIRTDTRGEEGLMTRGAPILDFSTQTGLHLHNHRHATDFDGMQAITRTTTQEGSGSDSEIASGRETPAPETITAAVADPEMIQSTMLPAVQLESLLQTRSIHNSAPPLVQLTQNNPRSNPELDQSGIAQFYRGKIIPKEQDVFWALEIIAFVSKYSHLRREMQDTHYLPQLSRRSAADLFNALPTFTNFDENMMDLESSSSEPTKPGHLATIADLSTELPNMDLPQVRIPQNSLDMHQHYHHDDCHDAEMPDADAEMLEESEFGSAYYSHPPPREHDDTSGDSYYKYEFENDVDIHEEFRTRSVNLFEIVEKFTALRSMRELPHWACIIMRNFVRKDEGGIRQCANFACGKWEEFPRQFAKCRRCKRTKYCSRSCQLNAWSTHRYWCSPSSSASQQSSQANQATQANQTPCQPTEASTAANAHATVNPPTTTTQPSLTPSASTNFGLHTQLAPAGQLNHQESASLGPTQPNQLVTQQSNPHTMSSGAIPVYAQTHPVNLAAPNHLGGPTQGNLLAQLNTLPAALAADPNPAASNALPPSRSPSFASYAAPTSAPLPLAAMLNARARTTNRDPRE